MKQFTIDFANVKTYFNFYEAIIAGLQLPDWCGKNPDAIWDMLTGYIEYPATIRLHGTALLLKDLESEMNMFADMFKEISDTYDYTRFTLIILS